MKEIHICSFSSTAAELKRSLHNENGVLCCLKYHPRISTFDMGEKPWLRRIIKKLERGGMIESEKEPYPWHKWKLTEKGEVRMDQENKILTAIAVGIGNYYKEDEACALEALFSDHDTVEMMKSIEAELKENFDLHPKK